MSKISLAGSSLFVGVMEIIIRFSVLELGLFSYNRCLARLISKTFIEAPKQRNPKDENELIKANRVPVNWTKNKRAQRIQLLAGQLKVMRDTMATKIGSLSTVVGR